MASLLACWVALQMLLLGGLSHTRAQTELYSTLRTELAQATAPVGGSIEPGSPVALLRIPSLGVEEVVVEGTASGDTLAGPGHRRDTPLPGQAGVSLVYGRAATYGAPFGRITTLKPGDAITTVTGAGSSTFVVDRVRHAGDPLPTPLSQGKARLTLVSGEPGSGPIGGLQPGSVVYVDASLRTPVLATAAGRPLSSPESEHAMAVDVSAAPLLTLCLAVLIALSHAVLAARRRWPTPLVWVVAAPVVLAVAWFSTDTFMRLLPNVF